MLTIVLRRQDQYLEHRHRVIGRTAALGSIAVGQRRNENRMESLKIYDPAQLLKRITMRREPLQAIR